MKWRLVLVQIIHPMDRSSQTLIGLIFIQLNPSQTGSWLPFKINTIFQIKLHIPHPLGVYRNSDVIQLEPRSLTLAEVRLVDCLSYYSTQFKYTVTEEWSKIQLSKYSTKSKSDWQLITFQRNPIKLKANIFINIRF